ncbi:MAG TPA: hypothetical protein VJN70_06790 [Gemmatimonadaceae bacterium]|nr:hypothetical protein [Gemmatimonadaceae bacterium]
MIRQNAICGACLALMLLTCPLSAQSPTGTGDASSPQRGWISLGVGAGGGRTIAGELSGWYSVGAFVGGVQWLEGSTFSSDAMHRQVAVLAGLRTRGTRFFTAGALGLASAEFAPDTHGIYTRQRFPSAKAALAFSAQTIANVPVAGLSLGSSGALGARDVSYAAVTLAVCVGWFGA